MKWIRCLTIKSTRNHLAIWVIEPFKDRDRETKRQAVAATKKKENCTSFCIDSYVRH